MVAVAVNNDKISQFPETYPYISRHGVVYTKKMIDELFLELRTYLFQKRINADEHNLDMAELILRMINHYRSEFGVPLALFAKVNLLRQVRRAIGKRRKVIVLKNGEERIEIPVKEVELHDNLVSADEGLTKYKEELYGIVKHVHRTLGREYGEQVRLKSLGYTDKQISEKLDTSLRTLSRRSERIREVLEEYK